MQYVTAVLRLSHILTAVIWFGLGLVSTYFVSPAALNAGESGIRFLKQLYVKTPILRLFPITAGLTTLLGISLYLTGSANRFTTLGNIVLGIGALAGLAATIHGGITGRASGALAQSLSANVDEDGTIKGGGEQTIRAHLLDLERHARISFALMLVALVGMASARYL